MRSTIELLATRFKTAIAQAVDVPGSDVDPMIRRSQDDRFGDYQSNCAMALAKKMGAKPRDLAEKIKSAVDLSGVCEPLEIAGPGFINIRLQDDFVARELASILLAEAGMDRLGIAPVKNPTVAAVDMSSPNLAKEMHVGHLRSTIIGDCIARVLEFFGHDVHRINHVGDWGTQFGMLLAHLRRTQPAVLDYPESLVLGDLEEFYVQAKRSYDSDASFAEVARSTVVELQRQEPAVMAIWWAFCAESLRHCHEIYERLDVAIEDRGESFYRDRLAGVVQSFQEAGLARESDGAICVFLDGYTTREGTPLPMIIRKSDGGYNYDTTDLAAIQHRLVDIGTRKLIYVVGVSQKQHFDMLFAAARKIGWVDDEVQLEHVGFGNLLGSDGRPFKTREGGTVKLRDLLDEAVARARGVVERNVQAGDRPGIFDEATIESIASAVGIGAIKYFDLSHSLGSDYKFDWETMLAMEGNTAPYMLYAYARVRSIGRKAGVDFSKLPGDGPIQLFHESEIKLGKALLRFAETVHQMAAELRPNILTDYLYELSRAFSVFYDRRHGVRVIDAESDEVRQSRLRLCDLTARTLKLGLGLLGIRTVEQM